MLSASSLPAIRLLITERDPASREAFAGLLRRMPDFDLIGAVPAEEAIPQARLHCIDVVLLDIVKPHEASVAICRGLSAHWPSLIVIALTTFADPDEEQALLSAGAAGYLLKEVHFEKLAAAIREIVAQERSSPDHSCQL